MNKIVVATLAFAAGAGFGFAIGYYASRKENVELGKMEAAEKENAIPAPNPVKEETPIQKKPQNDIFKITPAKLAKPDEPGINYSAYVKDLKYKMESEHPSDDDPEEDDKTESGLVDEEDAELDPADYEETYEERVERENREIVEEQEKYKREHKGKIEVITEDEWDTDFPETDYERVDLYYFTESDVLCDEDGNKLDENEYIGPKPRQFGWMRSPDDTIYIRNHPKEKDYRVMKQRCSVEDWWS